ncbi:MAG: hypothetical protein PUJ39_02325 [Eubacteriales bacterium]|nr:hypothetical protein [Eubacteriales bacterium]
MFYANTFTLKMENKKMAAKALEVMREALAQIDADGFKYDSRKTVDDFANDLMVKGSAVIAPGNCGLMPDANHIAIPEMFKAVARCFCFDKFTTKVFFDSDYYYSQKSNCFCWHPLTLGKDSLPMLRMGAISPV